MKWTAIDPSNTILRAAYNAGPAVSHTTLLRLGEDTYLAYSAGKGLQESAAERVGRDARILVVAPVESHVEGAPVWVDHFPNAELFASAGTRKRLERITKFRGTRDLEALAAELPPHVILHEVPDSRFGEVWVEVRLDDTTYWLVGDGIMNLSRFTGGWFLQQVQKLYGLRLGLWITPVFRFGLRDKSAFREWALQRFSDDGSQVLIPCHGDVCSDADLMSRLRALVTRRS